MVLPGSRSRFNSRKHVPKFGSPSWRSAQGRLPTPAFKVGETTVEIAGHYYGKVIGLHDYLVRVHLIKRGLRFFFPFGDNSDIARRVELSPPDR